MRVRTTFTCRTGRSGLLPDQPGYIVSAAPTNTSPPTARDHHTPSTATRQPPTDLGTRQLPIMTSITIEEGWGGPSSAYHLCCTKEHPPAEPVAGATLAATILCLFT